MSDDENRIVTRDEFESIRAAFWDRAMSGQDSLRYKIFDLGTLLLRNDTDGVRRKTWRDEVSDWMYVAMNRDLQEPYNPHLTYKGAVRMIENAISEMDSWLLHLGKAVMEPDQEVYFKVRLNNLLFLTNNAIAEWLWRDSLGSGTSTNQNYNLDKVDLTGLTWKACCATDGGHRAYTFTVGETAKA